MKFIALVSILTVAVFLSCCLHEAEGSLKLLKLVKAGLIIKALKPKKIFLPLPLPIPIGIHKDHHHYEHSHHGFHHEPHYDFHSLGHGPGYSSHGYGHGYGHGPYEYKTTGYHISTGFWHK